MKREPLYYLTTFASGEEQLKYDYTFFESVIEENGCVIIERVKEMFWDSETQKNHNDFNIGVLAKVKVYSAKLAYILNSKDLKVLERNSNTETVLDGWEYLQTYIKAYQDGEAYFETNFALSPDTIYGINAESYVRDIHFNYFHQTNEGGEAWVFVKNWHSNTLTTKDIQKLGYYSGIVSKVEAMVIKYPHLFEKWDKCEHSTTTTEKKAEAKEENNFLDSTIEDWLFEYRSQMNEQSYNDLIYALKHYFENGTFPIIERTITINGRPNRKHFGWAINRVLDAMGNSITKELLSFVIQNVSLYKLEKLNESDFRKSNLYKYFTTKTE